ncbi:MAG: hypothetical protein R3F60_10615 [bacterium]
MRAVAGLAERLRAGARDPLDLALGLGIGRLLIEAGRADQVAEAFRPSADDDDRLVALALVCMVESADRVSPTGAHALAYQTALEAAAALQGRTGPARIAAVEAETRRIRALHHPALDLVWQPDLAALLAQSAEVRSRWPASLRGP